MPRMTSWSTFHAQAPDLAAAVQERLDAHKHKILATLRRDGSPRVSGIETSVRDGELWLGGMARSLKCLDLLRDPRFALHSAAIDPPDDPVAWPGDAKIAGLAEEVIDPEVYAAVLGPPAADGGEPAHLFSVSVTEAVLTRVAPSADHLLIESWHEGRGTSRAQRW